MLVLVSLSEHIIYISCDRFIGCLFGDAAIAPIGAISPSSIASPPTTSVVGANELAPAPAPVTTSDSTGLAISVGSLLVALLVSMLSFS